MRRYFFHYCDGDKSAEDTEGVELTDEATSVLKAMLLAKEIVRKAQMGGGPVPQNAAFSVTDEQNRQLYNFPFSLVVDRPARTRKR
jgi:hypothetical protein